MNGWSVARVWGVAGVAVMLGIGVWRLAERGIITLGMGLSRFEWTALVLFTLVMIWSEGIRGIQGRFSPMVHRRAARLHARRRSLQWMAPLYCMALIGGRRRMIIRSWIGMAAILAAVLIVRALPHPWRGIIDLAVAISLGWGLIALLLYPLTRSGRPPE